MTTDELRSAAERIKAVERNAAAGDACWISRVYEWATPKPATTWDGDKRVLANYAADLILAEHPAEPCEIESVWLVRSGLLLEARHTAAEIRNATRYIKATAEVCRRLGIEEAK